jgi:ABC-type bacteriocin/lantibiotic exporter with double-glycine peptidase domain
LVLLVAGTAFFLYRFGTSFGLLIFIGLSFFLLLWRYSHHVKQLTLQAQRNLDGCHHEIIHSIEHRNPIRAMGLEHSLITHLFHHLTNYLLEAKRKNHALAMISGMSFFGVLGILVYFVWLLKSHQPGQVLEIGTLGRDGVIFFLLMNQFISVASLMGEYAKTRAALIRIGHLLEGKPDKATKPISFVQDTTGPNSSFFCSDLAFAWSPETKLFNPLTFSIKPGELVALMGSSGSGKSTLVKLMAGIIKPQSGSMSWSPGPNQDSDEQTWQQFRQNRLGVMLQEGFSPSTNLWELFHWVAPDLKQEEIQELCRNVGLEEALFGQRNHQPRNLDKHHAPLSGGQQQRLALALTLAKNPEFLLLDECTSALDALHEDSILSLLKSHKPITGLLVSHQQHIIRQADRIFLLNQGSLHLFDSFEALQRTPWIRLLR